MHITPPADDYGLQKLKESDSRKEVKESDKLEPYPRIESSEERHEPREAMVMERRKRQRRKRQRRQVDAKTTLDTREQHERRQQPRRSEDTAEPESDLSPRGFDDFV